MVAAAESGGGRVNGSGGSPPPRGGAAGEGERIFGRASVDGKNFDPGQGMTITLESVTYVVEVPKKQAQGSGRFNARVAKSVEDFRMKVSRICVPKRETFTKSVLRNVAGTIKGGEMYALLGPSGAGKTTLLDVISRRKTVGDIRGEILFDGKKISNLRLKTETAYIQQQDVLLGYFTVHEYILFHAFLKLPKWVTSKQKKMRCTYAIQKLGLEKCMHSRIGEPLKRGVSGGERKRVCIALGLLTEPKCLFLDEPTSGLDSHISLEVMRVVKSLSNDGRTVICTIHQPSQVIYTLFDNLILLQNGEVAYWGAGKEVAEDFFYQLGFPKEGYDNTAEYLLSVVSGAVKSGKGHSSQDLSRLFNMTSRCADKSLRVAGTEATGDMGSPESLPSVPEVDEPSSEGKGKAPDAGEISAKLSKIENDLKEIRDTATEGEERKMYPESNGVAAGSGSSLEASLRDSPRVNYHGDGYANGQLRELWVLISFKARAHFKDPHFLGTRIMCPLLFSLILASFWGTALVSQDKISTAQVLELAGLLFIIVGTNAFMTTFFVPAIMEERPVFIKERHDACYRVSSYVLHKVLIEAIANVPGVMLFSVPIYFATPLLNEVNQFFFFMLTLFTLNLCSSMLALAIASVSPTMEVAGALVPAILSLCALAGGFLKSFYSLPVWWQWFSVVDFIAWAYSALMMNQYQNQKWWYCLPPLELSSFLSGGTSSSGDSSDLGGALSLLGENGSFEAKCNRISQPTEFVDLDLGSCMLPVALQVTQSCFPQDFQVPQILSCDTICAPIFGESVISYLDMSWRFNRWISLAILAGQIPFFFAIFYLATRFMRHESR
ncbi:ABC transporter [Chloropicon primus]|uniref:ABC transporter n=2 Tax=Chloropicon primus TaxID=1764295 RepID=A0A5B8MFW0_9CHLO|nr:ABC transporter [Chloropicon primus]UPQ98545.1 ABC transporter [Chloropicon primus]|eukprot:QDZ19336.1 ABC transporter [Chloropicon primus]